LLPFINGAAPFLFVFRHIITCKLTILRLKLRGREKEEKTRAWMKCAWKQTHIGDRSHNGKTWLNVVHKGEKLSTKKTKAIKRGMWCRGTSVRIWIWSHGRQFPGLQHKPTLHLPGGSNFDPPGLNIHECIALGCLECLLLGTARRWF
jgi:hypothetical protein